MRRLLISALAALVAAPLPTAAVAFDDSQDDKVVCRRDREKTLGSNMRAPRTCRTRAQWRELEEQTQNEIQQIRDGQEPEMPEGGGLPAGPA